MTNNSEKRVIMLNGDGKKWYDQAIFIISEDCPKTSMPNNFISEAEKIINDYLMSSSPNIDMHGIIVKNKKKTKNITRKADVVLNVFMLCCCAVLAVLLYVALR